MSVPEFDIEQIAKTLNMRKKAGGPLTVLFLGSRTGSLFRHSFLAELLKGFTNRDILNMTPVERFHECYQILEGLRKQNQESDIHFIIRKAVQEKQVEAADLCVAELMKQRIFDCIITTNIGNELEDAFRQSGMTEHRDFEVIIPESGEPIVGRMTRGQEFKIIKASGDVFSQRYAMLGNKGFFLEAYPHLKTSLEQVKDQNMLMVGFDYKWDSHLIPTIFPRRAGSLWYVNEEQTTEISLFFPYLQDYEAKRFEGTIGGYEPFFVNLCKELGTVPTTLTTQATRHKQEGDEKPHTSDHIHQPLLMTKEQNQLKQASTKLDQRDFFISYNSQDRQWGEWIAWQLEHAGYTVFIQAWDFLPGGNFVLDMQRAASQSKRTIAVLSENYLNAQFTQSEWAAAFVQDPTGERGILLPVRVGKCEPRGILKSIVYIDLLGLDKAEARKRLLNNVGGVIQQRIKPDVPPSFPG